MSFSPDFQDDGGTPAWRQRHATIEAHKPGILARWRRLPLFRKLIWIVAIGFVVPWAVIIGGVVGGSLTFYLMGK